uniref:Uncharacterized protein n=1 Tax=Anguilla anguilla TaxID=7936 RepID=A0A0E9UG68_ANGAN
MHALVKDPMLLVTFFVSSYSGPAL